MSTRKVNMNICIELAAVSAGDEPSYIVNNGTTICQCVSLPWHSGLPHPKIAWRDGANQGQSHEVTITPVVDTTPNGGMDVRISQIVAQVARRLNGTCTVLHGQHVPAAGLPVMTLSVD